MHRRNLMAGAAALTLLPAIAHAQTQAPSVDAAKLPALAGGDFATVTSQLALNKATNPSVKTFAELEIAEQAAVAAAFGVRPGSAGLRRDHAAMVAQLQAADGQAFDSMYIDGQITGHRELLRIHQSYARNGQDPMARGASMVGVPSIETHLIMLQSIRRLLA